MHDGTVLVLCETTRLNNLSLNSKRMQFKSTDCKFFGHRLTPDGIKVDPKKIEAIVQMDPPQSVASLQSFNGMVNYLKKFSPVLSELSEPLRRLCKSGIEWAWESEQQNAFEPTLIRLRNTQSNVMPPRKGSVQSYYRSPSLSCMCQEC